MVVVDGLAGPSRKGSLTETGLSLFLESFVSSLLFLSLLLLLLLLSVDFEEEGEEPVALSSSLFDHVYNNNRVFSVSMIGCVMKRG